MWLSTADGFTPKTGIALYWSNHKKGKANTNENDVIDGVIVFTTVTMVMMVMMLMQTGSEGLDDDNDVDDRDDSDE